MPSTPTTKSQVQAYRFVLRRMQSALVRKDAVMLHDPMRTHSRATIVGVCLAALGLLGFLIWGILQPKPKVPTEDGIVIGKPSGQVYVLMTQPKKRLIPVFNLASARLLLHAQTQGDEEDQVGGVGGPGTGGTTEVAAPTIVDDNELRDQIPRTRKVGIADGPELLPSKDQRIESLWTVCDQYVLNENVPDQSAANEVETSVVAGVRDRGAELRRDASLLVKSPDDQVYLVYRTPSTANAPNDSTVRAKVDLEKPNITEALDLDESDARVITTGLLNAIPEKEELTAPNINGIGDQPVGRAPRGLDIGSVFSVQRTGQPEEFYVVLRNGVQQIKKTTGDLIRFKDDINAGEVERRSPEDVTGSDRVRSREDDPSFIDDSTFPEQQTEVLRPDTNPVVCLGWQTAEGGTAERTSVHVGKRVPGVPLEGDEAAWIDISTPGSSNLRIDHFYMPPGRGAVVRQATSAESFDSGAIALISDRGVKYGVPDKGTADALGLDNPLPAPDAILRLLPDGSSLDWRDVEQSYDRVPIEGGEYPSKSPDGDGGSGQSGGR